jgi:hypothetical protein
LQRSKKIAQEQGLVASIREDGWVKVIPTHELSDDTAKVIYQSKDGQTQKTFDALKPIAHPFLLPCLPLTGLDSISYLLQFLKYPIP